MFTIKFNKQLFAGGTLPLMAFGHGRAAIVAACSTQRITSYRQPSAQLIEMQRRRQIKGLGPQKRERQKAATVKRQRQVAKAVSKVMTEAKQLKSCNKTREKIKYRSNNKKKQSDFVSANNCQSNQGKTKKKEEKHMKNIWKKYKLSAIFKQYIFRC